MPTTMEAVFMLPAQISERPINPESIVAYLGSVPFFLKSLAKNFIFSGSISLSASD